MKQYIGTKLIEAEKAYRVDGKTVTLAENRVPCGYKVERGYKVRYADGYESFSPAEVFERAYLPLEVNSRLKTESPSISQGMVDAFIASHETMTMGGKTTVVRAVLKNGFVIVESSTCVSVENYDEKLGEKICMEKVRGKVWELLGFLLQTAVGGVNGMDVIEGNCCGKDATADALPTVRLFISQPMRGMTNEEIERKRAELVKIAKNAYLGRGRVEVIDSFFKGGLNVPPDANAALYHLSRSLELLATADAAIFAEGWRDARGCCIEHECVKQYGIPVIEPSEEV